MANKGHSTGAVKGITGVCSTGFIDYISFTLPEGINLGMAVETLLGVSFEKFVITESGRNGYRKRYEYGNVTILTDGGKDDMGHNITLTGESCRRHQNRLKEMAAKVFAMGGHFTRCDLTIDDRQGLLDMDEMQQAVTGGLVLADFTKVRDFKEHDRKTGQLVGRGIYFGSRKSEIYIRIYDKALEQEVDYHWIRVELELKGSKADAALRLAQKQEVGEIVRGVLKDRLSFRELGNGVNRSRWPVAPWWTLFLGCVEKLKLLSEVREPVSQEARLVWFVSNSATFAELFDVCGPGIIPFMYIDGKQRLEQKGMVH